MWQPIHIVRRRHPLTDVDSHWVQFRVLVFLWCFGWLWPSPTHVANAGQPPRQLRRFHPRPRCPPFPLLWIPPPPSSPPIRWWALSLAFFRLGPWNTSAHPDRRITTKNEASTGDTVCVCHAVGCPVLAFQMFLRNPHRNILWVSDYQAFEGGRSLFGARSNRGAARIAVLEGLDLRLMLAFLLLPSKDRVCVVRPRLPLLAWLLRIA